MPSPELALPVPQWRRPWSLTLYGLTASLAAVLLARLEIAALTPYRLGLIAASLILPGVAIIQRLRRGVTDLEDRTEPACLVGLAALIAFFASLAFDVGDKNNPNPEDSGIMLTRVLGVVALFGACLVALPSLPRKILGSLIILFHFGGILTAVTAVAPTGGQQAPWLAVQTWGYVYHPYLQFMYMTNAFHFYSPDRDLPRCSGSASSTRAGIRPG